MKDWFIHRFRRLEGLKSENYIKPYFVVRANRSCRNNNLCQSVKSADNYVFQV